jgi:hypothetical protein
MSRNNTTTADAAADKLPTEEEINEWTRRSRMEGLTYYRTAAVVVVTLNMLLLLVQIMV